MDPTRTSRPRPRYPRTSSTRTRFQRRPDHAPFLLQRPAPSGETSRRFPRLYHTCSDVDERAAVEAEARKEAPDFPLCSRPKHLLLGCTDTEGRAAEKAETRE